jgi:outer membrane receptor protein involved in Fe transport
MKVMNLLVLCLCFCMSAQAQKPSAKTEISGTATDSLTGKPMRTASVSLLAERDSAYVTANVTDGDGWFRIRNVSAGTYRLLVTFVGYRNASRTVVVQRSTPVNVGTILMQEQSGMLNEVVIKQERPPVTIKQDTLEFNAGSFKTEPNAQVEELLRKLPGVEVARDGTIRANGQAVNKVLVDGKPFFGNDPKMATRNLPADIVDKVQLYDQSSDQSQFSGVDDGNRERTINLTIKKDKGKGYFGQNALGAGKSPGEGDMRYQGRLNVNRFNNRNGGPGRQVSVIEQANNLNQQNFTLQEGGGGPTFVGGPDGGGNGNPQTPSNIIEVRAAGINYRNEGAKVRWGKRAEMAASYFANQAITTTDQHSKRDNILPERPFTSDQTNFSQNKATTHRFNGRFDFQLDSLTSLRITPSIGLQSNKYNSLSNSVSHLADGTPLNSGNTKYNSDGDNYNGYNNLLLMRKFRREGRSFSANVNTVLGREDATATNQSSQQFYDSLGQDPVENRVLQRNRQNGDNLQNTLTLSYTEPLSLNKKIEFRYAYGNNRNGQRRNVFDFDEETGTYDQPNSGLSNHFASIFATHKAGLTMQTKRLRYSYAVGFDLQNAGLKVENRSADTSASRSYTHLLPSALFSYTFSGNRNLRLQYRSRVSPPTISQLQPVADNSNPLNVRLGNPLLKPEYYHNVTLTYNGSESSGERSVFMFASLNQSNNRISSATNISNSGAQTTQPVNAGGYWTGNGFLSLGRKISLLKLAATLTSNVNFTKSTSLINNENNVSNNMTLGQGLRIQSNYNEKIEYGVSGRVSYQRAKYSISSQQNTAYWSQYATADLHWQLPFNWVLTSDLTYTATTGRATGYNQQFTLWNAALAKRFLKGKQGEVRLQVFDLLNQNRSLVRNTSDSYVEDVQSKVLKRYFLVSFIYNLRKFGV